MKKILRSLILLLGGLAIFSGLAIIVLDHDLVDVGIALLFILLSLGVILVGFWLTQRRSDR